ncbi:MAG TPA: mechanosensitive ion channel family protein [Polyangiaceae bacterium]|nr:mechanosensitive ion channel family protein [Polyangiaceae bacterium]
MLELLNTWGFAFLGAGVVFVAFLVNRFAPHKRRRLRHTLLLYGLFAVTIGASRIMQHVRSPTIESWADHVRLFGDLFSAFTLVNLVALAVFDVALPALGVSLVAITGDLVVFGAYVFAALGIMKASGVTPSSVITTSAVVSGVLALSLQTTLGNVIGGVALQIDGSVHVDDWLQLPDGQQGKVVAIRWRHTVIETRNWDTIVVPNANLLAQNIVILGKRTGEPVQHRMWVYFNVDFRYPPSQVIDTVSDALSAGPIDGVAENPKPSVICYDLSKDGRDSFGYYAVRYWLTDLGSDDPTSSRVRARIYTALKRTGIPLARPAQTLFVTQAEDDTTQSERRKERRVHAIERVDLFHSLTPDEREFIAGHLKDATFTAGETVTKQGAIAHHLYILCEGSVQIRRHAESLASPNSPARNQDRAVPLAKVVATIDAPNFFGEMGLMTGEPRTADVVALTDVECYRLDKEGLQRILEDRPEVAEQFSKTLAKRRVDLATIADGLDAEAGRARMASEETRILDKIQEFFGLARTTKV